MKHFERFLEASRIIFEKADGLMSKKIEKSDKKINISDYDTKLYTFYFCSLNPIKLINLRYTSFVGFSE